MVFYSRNSFVGPCFRYLSENTPSKESDSYSYKKFTALRRYFLDTLSVFKYKTKALRDVPKLSFIITSTYLTLKKLT